MLKHNFCFELLFFLTIVSLDINAQDVVYQDTFYGGVSGAGFSTGMGTGSGETYIKIEPNSTIKKIFMLYNRQGYAADIAFTINNIEISTDTLEYHNKFNSTSTWCSPKFIYFRDITELIVLTSDSISITIPLQSNPICWVYNAVYFVVLYENSSMPAVNVSILLNNQDLTGNEVYSVGNLNSINTDFQVGFALFSDRICNYQLDGNNIFINNNYLGLTWGNDGVNESYICAGVKGHFYYQGNQLFGLDDDTPNSLMNNSDGLADISSYLSNNTTSCNFQIQHANYPNQSPAGTNANLAYTLAYTTPCLPFETTLTEEVTTCRGDTAQLLATGGSAQLPNAYEWLPQEDLSCYNCPNPVFEGDSSKVYTVRIWNTDSCSKVLPVKVNVLDAPHSANLSTNPATCGESDGGLVIGSVSGGQPGYQYSLGDAWTANATANIFSNLPGGDYTFYVRDQNQCYYSQDFTIEEFNPAHAAFTSNPQSGTEPLDVNFYNQSSGTNQYEWTVQDSISNDFDFNFTFDSAGTYLVQLISWYNETHCADTAMATIIVHPTQPDYSHSIFVPTLYAPPMDNLFIETTNVQRVEFEIYNAIGQHIFSTTLDVADGRNEIWNGSRHARGYYFFRIKYWDVQGVEFRERGKVLVVR